jgi:hypothetical protein
MIELPLFVMIPRKTKEDKKFVMNINSYRNTHHIVLNDAKKQMAEYVISVLRDLEWRFKPPLRFTYTVFPGNGRKFDLANVLSVVQKFTDDALITAGLITDDNYKVVRSTNYRFGGIDKVNPRAELMIEEMEV